MIPSFPKVVLRSNAPISDHLGGDHKPSQAAYNALLEPEFEVVRVLDDASRLLPHVSDTQPDMSSSMSPCQARVAWRQRASCANTFLTSSSFS
jgi:hypothetical protein